MKILLSLFALLPIMGTNSGVEVSKSANTNSSYESAPKKTVRTSFWKGPLKVAPMAKGVPNNQPAIDWMYGDNNNNVLVCASNNGQYTLVMQADANLVLYKGGSPLWSTNTDGHDFINYAQFSRDGNLYLGAIGGPWSGNVYWDAGVYIFGADCYWILQDDGNFVRYGDGNTPSTGTAGGRKSKHNHYIRY